MSARRAEWTLALAATAICFLILEQLPLLKRRTPTLQEVTSHFGTPYPAAHSDYLTFTLPPDETIAGSGYGRITTNAMGYRGPFPLAVEKAPHVRRLLFLGDSFALGWGLGEDETIPALIQSRFDEASAPWEVINAAYHAGCSPDAYYAYLRREGHLLDPDALVVLLYTENDVSDLRDNVWVQTDEAGGPRALYTFRTYTDYRGRMLDPDLLPSDHHLPALNRSRVFLNVAGLVSRVFTGVGVLGSGRLGVPLPMSQAWKRFEKTVEATRRFAVEQRIPLAYVALGRPGTQAEEDATLQRMKEIVASRNIPFLMLHGQLTREHEIPGDGHLNPDGAEVAAAAIQQFLSDQGLGPPLAGGSRQAVHEGDDRS